MASQVTSAVLLAACLAVMIMACAAVKEGQRPVLLTMQEMRLVAKESKALKRTEMKKGMRPIPTNMKVTEGMRPTPKVVTELPPKSAMTPGKSPMPDTVPTNMKGMKSIPTMRPTLKNKKVTKGMGPKLTNMKFTKGMRPTPKLVTELPPKSAMTPGKSPVPIVRTNMKGMSSTPTMRPTLRNNKFTKGMRPKLKHMKVAKGMAAMPGTAATVP